MVGPNHLKFELQKVWYSNVSGFQIPTVLHVLIFQSNSIPGSRDLSPCSSTTDRLAHPRLGSIQTSTDGKAQKSLSVCAIFNIYSGIWNPDSLDFKWSKRVWISNGPGVECDLKSGPTVMHLFYILMAQSCLIIEWHQIPDWHSEVLDSGCYQLTRYCCTKCAPVKVLLA